MSRSSFGVRQAGPGERARLPGLIAGFTMVELVTVMVVLGILSAIGASRFFDRAPFDGRAYADQAKTIIRYAQKLAISQNRAVYVSANGDRFAACFDSSCSAANLAIAPGGKNSGSSATQTSCTVTGYVESWLCEGRPANTVVAAQGGANLAAGGYFFFDAMGRPYKNGDALTGASTFTQMVISFTSGGSTYTLTIEPETGYVHN